MVYGVWSQLSRITFPSTRPCVCSSLGKDFALNIYEFREMTGMMQREEVQVYPVAFP